MRSKNCVSFFFSRRHFWKVLNPLLSYLPVFWLQISSAFAIIFADCCGFSCVHVHIQHSFEFLCMLSGLGWVGLAQKISARCNTASYVFSFFFICIFILFLALSHMYVYFAPSVRSLRFGSRLWNVNIEQNWNLFYHYLFQRTPVIYNFISQENVFLFAIYFH